MIADAEVTKREHWPKGRLGSDHLNHTVSYRANRINDGRWRVVAHRGVTESDPHGCGCCVYDRIPAAIIIIDMHGIVKSYTRKKAG